jgi:hypothetical protein
VPRPSRRRGRIGRSAAGVLGTLAVFVGTAFLGGLASLAGGVLPGGGATTVTPGRAATTTPTTPTTTTATTTRTTATRTPTTRTTATRTGISASGDLRSAARTGEPCTRTTSALARSAAASAVPRGVGSTPGDVAARSWRPTPGQPDVSVPQLAALPTPPDSGLPGVRAPPANRTA